MLPVGHVWLSDAMSKIVAAGIKTVPSDHVAWIIENVLSARLQAYLTGEHGTFVADIHGLSRESVTMAIEHGPTEHEFGSGSLRGWLSVIEDELLRRAARKPLRESQDHIWYRELAMFLGETAIRALIGELRSGTRKAIAMCSSGERVDLTTDHWAPPLSKDHRRSFINFRELVVRGQGQFTLELRGSTITVTYGDGSREKFSANWLKRPGRPDTPDQNMGFISNWGTGRWKVLIQYSEAEIDWQTGIKVLPPGDLPAARHLASAASLDSNVDMATLEAEVITFLNERHQPIPPGRRRPSIKDDWKVLHAEQRFAGVASRKFRELRRDVVRKIDPNALKSGRHGPDA